MTAHPRPTPGQPAVSPARPARPADDRNMAGRAFDTIGKSRHEAFPDRPGQVAAGAWLASQVRGERAVLDVGCGCGLPTAAQLASAGCAVVGVDPSAAMLELARKNVPSGIFVERDLRDLTGLHPVQGRFDGVTAFFSLALLARSDIGTVLDRIRGVLTPEGLFAIGMVQGDPGHLAGDVEGASAWLTAYSPQELRHLLQHHGFTVAEFCSRRGESSAAGLGPQVHLYACCRVTPAM